MADIEKIKSSEIVSAELLGDLRKIIDSARSHVAATAVSIIKIMDRRTYLISVFEDTLAH